MLLLLILIIIIIRYDRFVLGSVYGWCQCLCTAAEGWWIMWYPSLIQCMLFCRCRRWEESVLPVTGPRDQRHLHYHFSAASLDPGPSAAPRLLWRQCFSPSPPPPTPHPLPLFLERFLQVDRLISSLDRIREFLHTTTANTQLANCSRKGHR